MITNFFSFSISTCLEVYLYILVELSLDFELLIDKFLRFLFVFAVSVIAHACVDIAKQVVITFRVKEG